MSPTVAEMSVAELRALIEELLDEKLEEFLGDSDAGLTVRSDVREELLRQMRRVRRGEYGVPLSGIQD